MMRKIALVCWNPPIAPMITDAKTVLAVPEPSLAVAVVAILAGVATRGLSLTTAKVLALSMEKLVSRVVALSVVS
jgi:hypothetical protein